MIFDPSLPVIYYAMIGFDSMILQQGTVMMQSMGWIGT